MSSMKNVREPLVQIDSHLGRAVRAQAERKLVTVGTGDTNGLIL